MNMRLSLVDMLDLQNTLNAHVNPHWLTANYPWTRAIRIECAELTEHLGWKWWKAQTPDLPQARIEVVDIWHFMLSASLVETGGDVMAAADRIINGLDFPPMEVITLAEKSFTLAGLTQHEAIDMLSMFASLGYVVPPLLEKIMSSLDMTWGDLYRTYVAKNVLNVFRQDHGYKDGSYIKIWDGEEDNVVLDRLMNTDEPLTAYGLRANLEAVYAIVKARRSVGTEA